MKDRSLYWVLGIGTFCLGYAILRYHVLKGIGWEYFPLYVFNKALSLTAIVLFAFSFCMRIFDGFLKLHKGSGVTFACIALVLAVMHSIISGLLLHPLTYPRIFSGEQINFMGQASLLLGVSALMAMTGMGLLTLLRKLEVKVFIESKFFSFLKYGTLGLTAGHVLFLGFQSWIEPEEWPGYLLPITLVAFIALFTTVVYRLFLRKNVLSARFRRPLISPRTSKAKELL